MKRDVAQAPPFPRIFVWAVSAVFYHAWCRWRGHSGLGFVCIRCGTQNWKERS